MLSRVNKDGFEPIILKYYEDFKEKKIPSKYKLYSNKEIGNNEIIASFLNPFCYISFDCVLSDFALIPDAIFSYIVAIPKFNDDGIRNRTLISKNSKYIFYEIPVSAFLKGLTSIKSAGKDILIATPEKALLDYIFVAYREFNKLTDFDDFFENYRFDRDEFMLLNFDKIKEIGTFYNSKRINLFLEYINKGEFNFD